MKKKILVIIDGNALLHRAWHAIPPLTTREGVLVNAVYGWLMIFFKMYKELAPDYIAVTFDVAGGTFRDELFDAYKAKRAKQPDELYEQIPLIKNFLSLLCVRVFEKQGFEADDVIGTITESKEIIDNKVLSIIVTGDMDSLQLVNEHTHVYVPKKGLTDMVIYDLDGVQNKYGGLTPEQIVDYKALRGDPSDNIPGVRGIGEKTAIQLIQNFSNIETIYSKINLNENILIDNGIKKRIIELLKENKENAFLSKNLARIRCDVPIDFLLKDCVFDGYNRFAVIEELKKFEFHSLVNKLPIKKEDGINTGQPTLFEKSEKKIISLNAGYVLVDTNEKFNDFLSELKAQSAFAFDTETTSVDKIKANLLGMSFCWRAGFAWYVVYKKEWVDLLRPYLEDERIKKYGHNIKYDYAVMMKYGVKIHPLSFDTMIASYLINPGGRRHSLDTVVFNNFGHEMIPIEALIGRSGKLQLTMEKIPILDVAMYSCEDADYTFRLVEVLGKKLNELNAESVFYSIEMPLIPVLAEMEKNGVLLDVKFLKSLSKSIGKDVEALTFKIYEYAGRDFNINSPAQLKVILFEKLSLSSLGLKKTKSGISTAAGELEKLKGKHPIIEEIMKYRELVKLRSTYIDALPALVDSKNRLHTSFNQTIVSTGRLSSSDPNLQNIPVRTEKGALIRKAFIAPSGYKILSADYSQFELRIIADLANDSQMISCFASGVDIHKQTASSIFDVPIDKVTKEQRYAAKAINFGVIYGLGAFGLSNNVGISRADAQDFIDRYFNIYKGVYDYLEKIKEEARELGYVETVFGRRRYLPEITSGVAQVRASAERMAINAPVQGTEADLIKMAMINIHVALPVAFPSIKFLLQVHDSLLFEVPEEDVHTFALWVKSYMEGVYKLRVPIVVDLEVGDSWGELNYLEV